MNVRIDRDFGRFGYKVWFWDTNPGGSAQFVRFDTCGEAVAERVENGSALPEPALRLSDDMLKALIAEASDVLPPSRAQAKHLDDVIGVRDRLLSLVEKQWDA